MQRKHLKWKVLPSLSAFFCSSSKLSSSFSSRCSFACEIMENDSYLSFGDTIMTLTIRKLCCVQLKLFVHRVFCFQCVFMYRWFAMLFNFFLPASCIEQQGFSSAKTNTNFLNQINDNHNKIDMLVHSIMVDCKYLSDKCVEYNGNRKKST